MARDDAPIRIGMEVLGADHEFVGLVTQVRAGDFLLRRSMLRQAYVPLSAVGGVRGEEVVLAVDAGAVDAMGWPNPLLGGA